MSVLVSNHHVETRYKCCILAVKKMPSFECRKDKGVQNQQHQNQNVCVWVHVHVYPPTLLY